MITVYKHFGYWHTHTNTESPLVRVYGFNQWRSFRLCAMSHTLFFCSVVYLFWWHFPFRQKRITESAKQQQRDSLWKTHKIRTPNTRTTTGKWSKIKKNQPEMIKPAEKGMNHAHTDWSRAKEIQNSAQFNLIFSKSATWFPNWIMQNMKRR